MSVKTPMLNRDLKTILPLSAVGELDPQPDRGASASPEGSAPVTERDPLTRSLYAELAHVSESELRALWGDR